VGGGITVVAAVSGTDLLIDTNGYFAPQQVVTSLNGLFGAVTLGANSGVTVTPAGNTLTIGVNATPSNVPNTIVRRDQFGGFAAETVTLSGRLALPPTTSSSAGLILQGAPLLHTFGTNNLFLGNGSGNFSMTGAGNTGVGKFVLLSNSTGSNNTAVGLLAMTANTTGSDNTAIGRGALLGNQLGNANTVVGTNALSGSNTGNNNTAIGFNALAGNTSGGGNIAVGTSAGSNLTTGNNNIIVGNQGVGGESATIRIGTVQTRAFLAGVRGRITGAADAIAVLIDSNGQLGTISSSRLVKEDIRDMGEGTERLMKLRPVVFRYTSELDPSRSRQYGLIAEEVAKVFPDLAVYDAKGRPETVKYHVLPSLLLNALQNQQQTIEDQRREIDDQRREIDELRARLDRLESQNERMAALEDSPR
jgi:Chaperone of endosialidase